MRSLNLFTKTTLLISAVIIVVFATAAYFYDSATILLERQQQQRRAELLATLMSEVIEIEQPTANIATLRKALLQFKQTHKDVSEIHIYGITPSGPREVLSYPAEKRPLSDNVLTLLRRQPTYSEIDISHRPMITVHAAAMIRSSRGETGVTNIDIQFDESTSLVHELSRLTWLLLALMVLTISVLIYWLFRSVIYRPLEVLLGAMLRVEAGDFNTLAPVKAADEIGRLSVGFNQMIGRLHEMSEKQKAYEQQLEERVRDATVELADRNDQLETANRQLYEIQRQVTQLERLAAAGQLAAQFAHEVGTPLNLISGHVQLLSTQLNDERSSNRLNIIASQIERIERIVRHMLDATRRPKAELRPLNINGLLQKIFEVTQPTLASKDVDLHIELTADLPQIDGDAEQLQQVFLNLINNSIDAMPNGGSLTFSSRLDDEMIAITCEDSGQGIPDEIQSRVFEPLFTTKERGHGTGLGLAVVRNIITEHRGRIELESRVGMGTKFNIYLPITRQTTSEPADKQLVVETR